MEILLTNPIIDAYHGSDLFGKIIFLSLGMLSMLTWIIFLQKFFLHKNAKHLGSQFKIFFEKNRASPLAMDVTSTHPYATLYQAMKKYTLEILGKNKQALDKPQAALSRSDIEWIETHLIGTICTHTKHMERNLFLLSTVVSLAPFLGLLGTVWGILVTFNELQMGASIGTNATIMGGLAMALGTTVAGLLVAIPALIGYNYLRAASAQFSGEMEAFSQQLLTTIEFQYRQVEIS